MDGVCAAPGCDGRAAATVRNEAVVCVDHYWLLRSRLEKLGVEVKDFQRPIVDLLVPDPVWAPIADALTDESMLVRLKAQQLRETGRRALRDLQHKRTNP